MSRSLDNAVVLITGGTGSLGQALVRRLLRGDRGQPERVIVFSRDEAKQYAMKTAWKGAQAATHDIYYDNFNDVIEFRIGDVRDAEAVQDVVSEADVVFAAAAMKQVPTCEYFPEQAVATNVIGTQNLVRAARRSDRTHTLVTISTDKACKPINVMGMTKALQERIVVEGNLAQEGCRMIAVRYGNVVSSRGSVIPLFRRQLAEGGPLTVTLPEMTRFLLTLEDAIDTVLTAHEQAEPGELFVRPIPAARVMDIAKHMIGDKDIDIEITGIRPGEKIHEVLVSEEEALRTHERAGHYVLQPQLPELTREIDSPPLAGEFSSADAVVQGEELSSLLTQADFVDLALP